MSEPEQDRPLHVRVAEALGWLEVRPLDGESWLGLCPPGGLRDSHVAAGVIQHYETDDSYVPGYDTDWSATGPLIERYGIDVDAHKVGNWTAQLEPYTTAGRTPLEAVCNLVLALAEAGKLPR